MLLSCLETKEVEYNIEFNSCLTVTYSDVAYAATIYLINL